PLPPPSDSPGFGSGVAGFGAIAGLTGLSEWDGAMLLGGASPMLAVLTRGQGAIALLASVLLALPIAFHRRPWPQIPPSTDC
ncbi:MAG: hypothetical protein HC918_08070, partial [Oscillatoriales cyanobacterium SM2_1_8]|nr:hypothetical protein [Oscillatoriales cyanobacterium SM2_1_8]